MLEITDKVLYPHTILREFRAFDAVKNVLKRDNLSALDLGCAFPIHLLMLYFEFNFQKLVGVDEYSQEKVVRDYAEKIKSLPICNSVYELLSRDKELVSKRGSFSETDFHKSFKLHFETDSLGYFLFSKQEQPFDYIILSNILHLLKSDCFHVFNFAVEKIKPGGLFFVRVTHEQSPKTKPPHSHIGFNEESFLKLFHNFNQIHASTYKPKGSTNIESLTYFGAKK